MAANPHGYGLIFRFSETVSSLRPRLGLAHRGREERAAAGLVVSQIGRSRRLGGAS